MKNGLPSPRPNFGNLDHTGKVPPLDAAGIKELQERAGSGGSDAVLGFRRGLGLGFDAVIVSVHQDFAAMDRFRTRIRQSDRIVDVDTFLVDLDDEKDGLPLTFSLLADKIQKSNLEKQEDKQASLEN